MKARLYHAAFHGDEQVTRWECNRDKVWKAARAYARSKSKGSVLPRIKIGTKLFFEPTTAEIEANRTVGALA